MKINPVLMNKICMDYTVLRSLLIASYISVFAKRELN